MIALRHIFQKVHRFFWKYYPYIWFWSLALILCVAFLHYELKHNDQDFVYWKILMHFCYNELQSFMVILVAAIIVLKGLMFLFLIAINTSPLQRYGDLSHLEVKKRYADFLFVRLISEIDKIEAKHLREKIRDNDVIALKSFILAHEDMQKTIANFRKDARRLLTPSEDDISRSIHEVYGIFDDELLMHNSRLGQRNITVDDSLIRSLVNS